MEFSKILSWLITILLIITLVARELCFYYEKNEQESWIIVSQQNMNTVFNEKNITKIAYDETMFCINKQKKRQIKNVNAIEFYAKDIEIHDSAFSGCKKLKEMTFYSTPKFIAKTAFNGCNDLSLIKLIGNREDFKGFSITVPNNCEVRFIPLKEIEILDKEKPPIIQADVYVYNTKPTETQQSITQNITNTTNTTTNNNDNTEVNTSINIDNSVIEEKNLNINSGSNDK